MRVCRIWMSKMEPHDIKTPKGYPLRENAKMRHYELRDALRWFAAVTKCTPGAVVAAVMRERLHVLGIVIFFHEKS